MFGGILCSANIIVIQELDLLITAFSHQLYLFSLQQSTLKQVITHHESPIVTIQYDSNKQTIISIDTSGLLVTFSLSKKVAVEHLSKKKKIFGSEALKNAITRVGQLGNFEVYGLLENGKLLRYSEGSVGVITQEASQILYLSNQYIIVKKNKSELQLISPTHLDQRLSYEHVVQITSVEIYQQNLIVGDAKGKIHILIGFLIKGQIQLKQKLQWHVHAVSSLRVEGAYLYSAGEEGVVVLWHLRENRKDFLPRISSQINRIEIINSKVYCLLSDNSIKSIDLNNDKSLLHYRVILNPQQALINQNSTQLIKSNLIRVSKLDDKIYLRSLPGRIQQINLHSGFNTQFNILNRNIISRLDNHLPSPHQLTDICFSVDNTHLAASIEGVGYKAIKFYEYDRQHFELVSKVQNCHRGSSIIQIIALSDNKFVSYSTSDSQIKVWKLSVRRKESILEIDQHFWCCEYQISYRQQLPTNVSFANNKLTISYAREFVVFNTVKKAIENTYQLMRNNEIVAVYEQTAKNIPYFVVFYQKSVELVKAANNIITNVQTILSLNPKQTIKQQSIKFNQTQSKFSLLIQEDQVSNVYIYTLNQTVAHFQIPVIKGKCITDIFWLKQRLIALDSGLFFYDLTHQRPLVNLSLKSDKTIETDKIQEQCQQQTTIQNDYQSLQKHYLQRLFRRDKAIIEKNNQILGVTPSINSAFQLLASNLFI